MESLPHDRVLTCSDFALHSPCFLPALLHLGLSRGNTQSYQLSHRLRDYYRNVTDCSGVQLSPERCAQTELLAR